jgi:HD-GYP domain-containing protein (c-di-GMP phosphodiesterase class II)
LAGDQIDPMARFASLAYAFVTQSLNNPGPSPKSPRELAEYLQAERGKAFDPILTDLLLNSLDEFHQLITS